MALTSLVRNADRSWFRWAVTGAVGLAVFLLGAAYLNLNAPESVTSLSVMGSDIVVSGRTSTLRVFAREESTATQQAVPLAPTIGEVTVDGEPVEVAVSGTNPALVTFRVPTSVRAEARVVLQVTAGAREEQLLLELAVVTPGRRPAEAPPKLSEATAAHRIWLYPEAGVLASGMDNRIFVWIRDRAGRPVDKAEVTIAHAALADGEVGLTTDAYGLAELRLRVQQPSFRFAVHVDDGKDRTKSVELLRAFGRRMALSVDPPVTPNGTRPKARVRTWRSSETLYCDLLRDEVLEWTRRVTTEAKEAVIDLGALDGGSYSLQCYDHAMVPGETYASVPFFVSDEAPLVALVREVRAAGLITGAALPADEAALLGSADQAADARLAAYLTARLRVGPVAPRQLLSTRKTDLQATKRKLESARSNLILALSLLFVVIMLWVGDSILRHMLRTRRQLKEFVRELEEGEMDVVDVAIASGHDGIIRTRGFLIALVVIGTLVLNIMGFMWALTVMG